MTLSTEKAYLKVVVTLDLEQSKRQRLDMASAGTYTKIKVDKLQAKDGQQLDANWKKVIRDKIQPLLVNQFGINLAPVFYDVLAELPQYLFLLDMEGSSLDEDQLYDICAEAQTSSTITGLFLNLSPFLHLIIEGVRDVINGNECPIEAIVTSLEKLSGEQKQQRLRQLESKLSSSQTTGTTPSVHSTDTTSSNSLGSSFHKDQDGSTKSSSPRQPTGTTPSVHSTDTSSSNSNATSSAEPIATSDSGNVAMATAKSIDPGFIHFPTGVYALSEEVKQIGVAINTFMAIPRNAEWEKQERGAKQPGIQPTYDDSFFGRDDVRKGLSGLFGKVDRVMRHLVKNTNIDIHNVNLGQLLRALGLDNDHVKVIIQWLQKIRARPQKKDVCLVFAIYLEAKKKECVLKGTMKSTTSLYPLHDNMKKSLKESVELVAFSIRNIFRGQVDIGLDDICQTMVLLKFFITTWSESGNSDIFILLGCGEATGRPLKKVMKDKWWQTCLGIDKLRVRGLHATENYMGVGAKQATKHFTKTRCTKDVYRLAHSLQSSDLLRNDYAGCLFDKACSDPNLGLVDRDDAGFKQWEANLPVENRLQSMRGRRNDNVARAVAAPRLAPVAATQQEPVPIDIGFPAGLFSPHDVYVDTLKQCGDFNHFPIEFVDEEIPESIRNPMSCLADPSDRCCRVSKISTTCNLANSVIQEGDWLIRVRMNNGVPGFSHLINGHAKDHWDRVVNGQRENLRVLGIRTKAIGSNDDETDRSDVQKPPSVV